MLAHSYRPGGPNYYSPYPTLTDLDGVRQRQRLRIHTPGTGLRGLGADAATLWERVQASKGLTIEERAKAVGYTIPRMPIGWKSVQGLWRTLVSSDIMALELGKAYQALSWQLAYGSVDCEELNLYNQAAIRHYEVQSKIAALLRMDAQNVVPGSVPFPALFIGRGQMGGKVGELICTPGQRVTKAEITPQAGCPGVIGSDVPGGGFQAAPLLIIVIGASFVLAVGIVAAAKVWNEVELAQIEALAAGAAKSASYTAARNEAVVELAKKCMAADPQKDPTKCIDAASAAIKDPGKVFQDAADKIAKVGGLSFWAWVGVGAALLAAGGGTALYLKRKKG